MHIQLPDDLNSRLEALASKCKQDVNTLVREAIETRLAMEDRLEDLELFWREDELRAEVQKGLDDLERGDYAEYDETTLHELFESVKARGRERLATRNQRPN